MSEQILLSGLTYALVVSIYYAIRFRSGSLTSAVAIQCVGLTLTLAWIVP